LLSLSLPRSLLLSSVPTITMRTTSSATLHMKDHSKMEKSEETPLQIWTQQYLKKPHRLL
jgi:hypothetical protein